jgi:hypothetical protein
MTRETEVADYLRADATLRVLVPGGIYPNANMPATGLTNAKTMTKVWANGVFTTTLVVRERAAVPTGDLQSTVRQHTSMSQAVEVWAYATTPDGIEAALQRVYALLMGKRLDRAFSATWAGGGPGIMQAPELPPGIRVGMESYRVVSIRRAA